MLQALFKNKLKDSFYDPTFRPSEDSLTSSVIGILQFLPDVEFWDIIRKACGRKSRLVKNIGKIECVLFWPRLDAAGTDNTSYVEPDVLIVSEQFIVIVEAKKTDEWGQHWDQWENEIKSVLNTYPTDEKKIILIALGGNDSLKEKVCTVDGVNYAVHTASWFNLLGAILEARDKHMSLLPENGDTSRIRLLTSAIDAMAKHNYLKLSWLSSFKRKSVDAYSRSCLKELLEFDNTQLMSLFTQSDRNIKRHNLNKIWMLRK